jgi:hypothetical protein
LTYSGISHGGRRRRRVLRDPRAAGAVSALTVAFPIKKWAAAGALAAAAFYLLLSGAEVATQRSFYMTAVVLVAVAAPCRKTEQNQSLRPARPNKGRAGGSRRGLFREWSASGPERACKNDALEEGSSSIPSLERSPPKLDRRNHPAAAVIFELAR